MHLSFRIHLPASLRSFEVWFLEVNTTMKALTPRPSIEVCCSPRSPCLSRLNFQTFRLQPPHCHFARLGLTRYRFIHRASRRTVLRNYHPPLGVEPRLGRGVQSEVRELLRRSPTGLAESSSQYSYGLFFRFRLLSTLSHENAVTFYYEDVTISPIRTFTQLFNRLHRRTSHHAPP